jgi:ATP-dependent Clp protease ATP-binding subunit ClpA
MSLEFSESARQTIQRAEAIAVEMACSEVGSAHLCLAALEENERNDRVLLLLQLSGVSAEEARVYARIAVEPDELASSEPKLSQGAKKILNLAHVEAQNLNNQQITVEHLFIACVRQQRGPHLGEVLRPLGLDAGNLRGNLLGLDRSAHRQGNPLNYLTPEGQAAIEAAHAAMRASYCGRISTAHLLLGLLDDPRGEAVRILGAAEVDIDSVKKETRAAIVNDGQVATPQKKFTPSAKRALERAKKASPGELPLIGPQQLLAALLPQSASLKEKLAFGTNVIDPLERVWSRFPVEEVKKQLEDGQAKQASGEVEFSEGSQKIFDAAYAEMQATACATISTAHLLIAILKNHDSLAVEVMQNLGFDLREVENTARSRVDPEHKAAQNEGQFSPGASRAMGYASYVAKSEGFRFVDSSHLLIGMLLHEKMSEIPKNDAKLWTSEQVDKLLPALSRKGPNIPKQERFAYKPSQANPLGRSIGFISFAMGFVCVGSLSRLSPLSLVGRTAIYLILITLCVSALGACVAILTDRTKGIKEAWSKLFFGFLLGIMLAMPFVGR